MEIQKEAVAIVFIIFSLILFIYNSFFALLFPFILLNYYLLSKSKDIDDFVVINMVMLFSILLVYHLIFDSLTKGQWDLQGFFYYIDEYESHIFMLIPLLIIFPFININKDNLLLNSFLIGLGLFLSIEGKIFPFVIISLMFIYPFVNKDKKELILLTLGFGFAIAIFYFATKFFLNQ